MSRTCVPILLLLPVASGLLAQQQLLLQPNRSVLTYSTYLGGGSVDIANAIATDAQGNVYVTGVTVSPDFPVTPGAFQTSNAGAPSTVFLIGVGRVTDGFVTKFNPAGNIVYSTYLGGASTDTPQAIAVDAQGNAYIAGTTYSTNFPVTPGAFQASADFSSVNAGPQHHAFITKLNAAGSALVYSTFLGGSGSETVNGIAVDSSGDAYVVGSTTSTDFPVSPGALQTAVAQSPPTGARLNGFAAKLNSAGSKLAYSTYLSGSDGAAANAVALGPAGDVFVTGSTSSTNFPVTPGAFQKSFTGVLAGFVSHLNPTGTALLYSTFLGGESAPVSDAVATGIAVDSTGAAYVTGATASSSFPVTAGAFQQQLAGSESAYVAKLDPAGAKLIYSTLLGGDSITYASSIAIDSEGNAYVTGLTFAASFPISPDAYQSSNSAAPCFENTSSPFMTITVVVGCGDAFVTKLDSAGSTLLYSTYFGGNAIDQGTAIALSPDNSIYVAGSSQSGNLPATAGAPKTHRGPDSGCDDESSPTAMFAYACDDAFLARFNLPPLPSVKPFELSNAASLLPGAIAPGELVTLSGNGIGPSQTADLTLDAAGLASTSLAGIRVLFNQTPAPLVHVDSSRIEVVVPYETIGQRQVQVAVETNGVAGPSQTIDLAVDDFTNAIVAPGIFTLLTTGAGPALCINEDGSINTPETPAAPGSVASLYVTGLGVTSPPSVDGSVTADSALPKLTTNVTVYVGGKAAQVTYAGPAPATVSGVMQVNFQVPAISGSFVPVYVSAANVVSSQSGVTISIQ